MIKYTLILIFLGALPTHAQNLKITYGLKQIVSKSLKRNVYMHAFVEAMESPQFSYILEIDKQEHFFYPIGDFEDGYAKIGDNKTKVSFDRISDLRCYTDLSKDSVCFKYFRLFKEYYVQGHSPDFDWNILNEQKEIGGMMCSKAIGTDFNQKKIEVWFCEDLPFDAGPYIFKGLPGMIMALKGMGCWFFVEKIEQDQADKSKWNLVDSKKWMTYTQFEEKMKDFQLPEVGDKIY